MPLAIPTTIRPPTPAEAQFVTNIAYVSPDGRFIAETMPAFLQIWDAQVPVFTLPEGSTESEIKVKIARYLSLFARRGGRSS